jgi:hypothetical protein
MYEVKKTLENTEGVIKNGQFRETGNIGYTRRRKTKQKQFRETVSYQDFLDRMFLLTRKQHNQWFVEVHVEIISSKVLLSSL